MESVRVGIIGPSWWVNFWHLPALQRHPLATIVAVCGTQSRDIAATQAQYGPDTQIFTDYDRMLDECALDGVIVCTPNDLHYPASLAVLNHNLHVCCEKPLALNAAQARELAEMARQRDLLALCNFVYRDNPNIAAFRQCVHSGYIGKLLYLTGQYSGEYGLGRAPGWRSDPARSGAGILADLGSHLIDLTRFVTGDEFAAVSAHCLTLARDPDTQAPPTPVPTGSPDAPHRNDDLCAWTARLQSGAQAMLHTSWISVSGQYGQHQELEAFGTGGRLHFTANLTGTSLRGLPLGASDWETLNAPGTLPPDPTLPPDQDRFRPARFTDQSTVYRWLDALAARKRGEPSTLTPDFTDGWRTQQVMDALLQSHHERREIALP